MSINTVALVLLAPPTPRAPVGKEGLGVTLNKLRCRSDSRLSDFDAELKKIGAARQATLQKKLKNEGVPGDQQDRNILGVVFDRQGSRLVTWRLSPTKPVSARCMVSTGQLRPSVAQAMSPMSQETAYKHQAPYPCVRCNRSNCFTWRQARRLVPETER